MREINLRTEGSRIIVSVDGQDLITEHYSGDTEIHHFARIPSSACEKYNVLMSRCAEIMINEKQSTRRAYAVVNLIAQEMEDGE